MALAERIQEFLQRLTTVTRGSLLTELERLELSDSEVTGATEVLAKLRAEFRKDGSTQNRGTNPSRYFFAPLEPLLVDGAPEHANSGRIQRGSLYPIWEWISRDLLPTMTRDYVSEISRLIAADKKKEVQKVAAAFQIKVIKSLEGRFRAPDSIDQTRVKLAVYTASHAVYDDLTRMLCVLRASDALAAFNDALPDRIENLDDARLSRVTGLLEALGKTHAEVVPFALALVARRLRHPWQLIRLATKAAPSKNAADIAATRFAITVSMVLDQLDDRRLALRAAVRKSRILVAKEILTEIYDTEYALQVRIDQLDQSDWGARLHNLMNAVAALVESETRHFPKNIGHVLASRRLRSHQSLAGRLTYLAWKGRDAMSGGAALCKKLVGQPKKSRT